jgi:hypothetical protein
VSSANSVILHVWCFDSRTNPVSLKCTSCGVRFLWEQEAGTSRPAEGLNFCPGCGGSVVPEDVVPGPRATSVDYHNDAQAIWRAHLLRTEKSETEDVALERLTA